MKKDEYIFRCTTAKTDDERTALFPFKRRFVSDDDIRKKFQNLQRHDALQRIVRNQPFHFQNVSSNIDTTFKGKHTLVLSERSDYNAWNILSDMWCEKQRLQTVLQTKSMSAWEYFFTNIHRVVEDVSFEDNNAMYVVREKLFYSGYECTSHRANLICVFVNLFASKRILDFSRGWGDRLIGAMSMDNIIDYYVGIDPNLALHTEHNNIVDFFGMSKEKYNIIVGKAEDVTSYPPNTTFDLIYTSPPYFRYEKYTTLEYVSNGEDYWLEKFMFPSLQNAWNRLEKRGKLALNLNQRPGDGYVEKVIDFMRKMHGAIFLGVIAYVNERTFQNPQPVWIWEKDGVNDRVIFATLFEKAALITSRAKQITTGGQTPIVNPEEFLYDAVRIAKYEVENKLSELNLCIVRDGVKIDSKNIVLPK